MNQLIQVFVKAPLLGKVKTRLAASVGAEAALNIHKALATTLIERVQQVPATAVEIWTPNPEHEFFSRFNVPVRQQLGKDLGQRMEQAMEAGLSRYQKVLLVGGDGLSLRADDFHAAFKALDRVPVCFVPTSDGGYVLVGMSQPVAVIFRDMTWGCSSVMTETLQRLRQAAIPFHLLPEGWDIDTLADLQLHAPDLLP